MRRPSRRLVIEEKVFLEVLGQREELERRIQVEEVRET